MKCNGCGGEFDYLGGIFGYGDIKFLREGGFSTEHTKTLCRGCHRVLISILLNSDLSEHWEEQDLPEEWLEDADSQSASSPPEKGSGVEEHQ